MNGLLDWIGNEQPPMGFVVIYTFSQYLNYNQESRALVDDESEYCALGCLLEAEL